MGQEISLWPPLHALKPTALKHRTLEREDGFISKDGQSCFFDSKFVDIFMWPLRQTQTWVGDRRAGPCSQPGCCPPARLSVGGAEECTHMQAHRDSHIMASLWDRENAKATVNVKTCPPSKTHGSPFTRPIRDKGTLYFSSYKPLDETSGSQRHRRVEENCPSFETTVSKCLSLSLSLSLSFSLYQSLSFSSHPFCSLKGQTQTKHIICNMHQWHR